jgi:predicted metal-dependent hydrolase
MSESIQLEGDAVPRMAVRHVPFQFAPASRHWNSAKPEFTHIVNAASLAMPYLEPYLIRSMRAARPLINDSGLQQDLDLYVKQEGTHYRQHREFNNALKAAGYQCIDGLEQGLAADYKRLQDQRSLRFNLAYAEGFESMALAIGEMLIADRVYLFGDSDPSVASLILWHFVEEIEHKNVAFDVLHHLHSGYFWRILGLVYATGHIFGFTIKGYHALLKEDGLWTNWRSRWKLLKLIGRLLGNILPRWLRIWRPGYHPKYIVDPQWGLNWATAFEQQPEAMAQLDTSKLAADSPLPA